MRGLARSSNAARALRSRAQGHRARSHILRPESVESSSSSCSGETWNGTFAPAAIVFGVAFSFVLWKAAHLFPGNQNTSARKQDAADRKRGRNKANEMERRETGRWLALTEAASSWLRGGSPKGGVPGLHSGLGGQVFTTELAVCWQCQFPRNYPADEDTITRGARAPRAAAHSSGFEWGTCSRPVHRTLAREQLGRAGHCLLTTPIRQEEGSNPPSWVATPSTQELQKELQKEAARAVL